MDSKNFHRNTRIFFIRTVGHIAFICVQDNVVAVSGALKKDFINKKMDPLIGKVIEERKALLINDKEDPYFEEITVIDESEKYRSLSKVISPIIVEGDAIGAVILKPKVQEVKLGDIELKMAGTASSFLAKQLGA